MVALANVVSVSNFVDSSLDCGGVDGHDDEDEMLYDQPWDAPMNIATDIPQKQCTACSLTYGPHRKLRRGYELYNVEQEFKMVNESKFNLLIYLLKFNVYLLPISALVFNS